ncbi:MAG TPA: diguanylate cyclase [Bacillota bacterium]|nr:diguanylate cyclase [Bacillota bacterium]
MNQPDAARGNELLAIAQAVLDSTMSGVLQLCRLGDRGEFTITYVNRSAELVERMSREELLGMTADELFPHNEAAILKDAFAESLKQGRAMRIHPVELRGKVARGWREVVIAPTGPDCVLMISLDISQSKTLEGELRHMLGRLNSLLAFLPDATMSVDNYGRVESWNQAMESLTGVPATEALGQHSSRLAARLYGEGSRCLTEVITAVDFSVLQQAYVSNCKLEGANISCEITLTAPDGANRFLSARATPLYDPGGAVAGAVASYRDMTERREMEERLRYLSVVDQLTGLGNRNFFEQYLEGLNAKGATGVGVLFCDIDGLKFVNDTMGHAVGDRVLQAAAAAMREGVNRQHIVARVGGDEFAVVVENTDATYMAGLAREVRRRVEEAANFTEMPVPINLSVGYSVSEKSFVPISRILKAADDNMYRDKLTRSRGRHEAAVKALLEALERRDLNGPGHAGRLTALLEGFAGELKLGENVVSHLRLLAQFHDVGTVGISESLFFKSEPLTKSELAEIRRHSETGHRIAQYLPDLLPLADDILKHHEWWNGEGYPLGLSGEEIPLTARLLSLADALDAMLCNRPYREALSPEQAISQIEQNSGKQFDPSLVKTLIPVMREYLRGVGADETGS